jgi:uncharacterized membrane protein
MKKKSIRTLTTASLIAAMYTVLTVCMAPLSYGLVQCRLSEALTILAAFTPAAIPGLTVGCVVSNLIGMSTGANIAGALDVLLGPLATGIAAWLTWMLRRYRIGGLPLWSTLPPVALNGLVVGTELAFAAPTFTMEVWFIQMGLVAAGQLVACVGGGLLVARGLQFSGLDKRM